MAQLSQKRLFLLDMDGTIYLSDRLFDRVPEFLARVRGSGGRAVFLTNNSSRGVEDYIEKLRAMGIETAREDYVTSVDAAIRHLRLHHPGRRCYVFGTRSFAHQLEQAGVPLAAGRDGADSPRSAPFSRCCGGRVHLRSHEDLLAGSHQASIPTGMQV